MNSVGIDVGGWIVLMFGEKARYDRKICLSG